MEEPLMKLLDMFEAVSPEAFGWMVQQATILGWLMFSWGIVLLVSAAMLTAVMFWLHKTHRDDERFVMIFILWAICIIIGPGLISDGVYHIYTPEAHALTAILYGE